MQATQPELTSYERNLVDQWKIMNDLLDARKILAKMIVGPNTAEVMAKYSTPVKAELDKKSGKYTMYFEINEFVRYTYFCTRLLSMKVQVDGSLVTDSGITIPSAELRA